MRYKVVFHGDLAPGTEIEVAKAKLAERFKLKPESVAALFCGRSVTVRKDVDQATAQTLQRRAAECGVIFKRQAINASAQRSLSAANAAGVEDAANQVTCDHCGLSQRRSTTCLQCGEFLIRVQKTAVQEPPIPIAEPVRTTVKDPGRSKKIWRTARISVLLLILLVVGLDTVMTGRWTTDWDDPLWVGIYPINGDHQEQIDDYIDGLEEDAFLPIAEYFSEEAQAYGLDLSEPFSIRLAPPVDELPPPPPQGSNPLAIMWWSLKMRLWVYQHDTFTDGPSPEIKIYLIYHDAQTQTPLENSLGMRKGQFGVVHAYAKYRLERKNHVVIAHEILHTVGATDKYDPQTHQPLVPDGLAEPDKQPLYPQRLAEIMGSRIPLSESRFKMPPSLSHTVIGEQTAQEIKWVE
jgi:hypothetical protein